MNSGCHVTILSWLRAIIQVKDIIVSARNFSQSACGAFFLVTCCRGAASPQPLPFLATTKHSIQAVLPRRYYRWPVQEWACNQSGPWYR